MKIGIDLHGVSFSCPEFFSTLGELFVSAGHEVHIITGSMWNEQTEVEMKEAGLIKGKSYTHFFSIVDYHIERGDEVNFDEKGDPWMEEDIWNHTKAEYCKRENILIHFDDQMEYLKHFDTPFCLFNHMEKE